jgi:hypothetical protein
VRRLLTLGQPHRNLAIQALLQSRRSLALLVALVLCLSALVLAANEAWAKEQPSPAAQQGPAEGKNTPNGKANGKVAEPVRGTPTPVTPPPLQEQPAVPPPVQTPPVENAPPPPTSETPPPVEKPSTPPTSETPPPAEKPSTPPLDPAPSTPEPDPEPQPTPQPAPQAGAGGEEDVESGPVPNTSQPPMSGSDRVVEPEPVSAASPDLVDEVKGIVHYLAPAPASAPATPAAADEGHAAGPAPDPVLPLPGLAAASDQVLPAASEGLAALVRGLVTEPGTRPATAPMAQWGDGGPLTTFTNNKTAASVAAAAVAAPVVGEALRLSSSLGTGAAGALGSAVGTVQSAAASAAASAASATAKVFRILASGSAGTPSTDATNGTQQAPSDDTQQEPVAPLAPPLGGVFSPFTGVAGQLGAGGGVAPLLVGILALLTVILTRRDFRTYLIACEMPKPSSALLRPLERPG